MTDHAKLRELANAATSGEWTSIARHTESRFGDGSRICDVANAPNRIVAYEVAEPDADYVAAANPRAVLGLLDEIERLRDRGNGYKEEFITMDVRHKAAQAEIDRLRRDYDSCAKRLAAIRAEGGIK